MGTLKINNRGFTLIETITVLIILGILAATVASQVGNDDAERIAAAEVIKGHLRYAQIKAMNSNVGWGINFANSPYTYEDADGNTATLPVNIPDVSVSATAEPILFDEWGSPGGLNITVSLDSGALSFTVTKNTGFIQ